MTDFGIANFLLNVGAGILFVCLLPFIIAILLLVALLVLSVGVVITMFMGGVYVFAMIVILAADIGRWFKRTAMPRRKS